MAEMPRVEFHILIVTILLCCYGAIMICSATGSMKETEDHFMFIAFGVVVILAFQFINYHILSKFVFLIYLVGLVCIFLLKTKWGVDVNGAVRWLKIFGFQFQVAEPVKLCVIIMLAWMVWKFYGTKNKKMLVLYCWLIGGVPALLLLTISNDLSSGIVVLGITFLITLLCTETFKLHAGVFGAAVALVGVYVYTIATDMPTEQEIGNLPFRKQRIAAWIDPYRYQEEGHQIRQSWYAIGSGGFWGKHLGMSLQKSGTLPEAETDFILAVLCEELGIFGLCLLLLLVGLLLYYIYLVAINYRKSIFGRVLCVGVFAHIAIQGLINLAVVTGVFPNTGLPFPFMSSGGTSLLCYLAEIAIVISVERRSVMDEVRQLIEDDNTK